MSETRKLKSQCFFCHECPAEEVKEEPGTTVYKAFNNRKEAMLHSKKTGHRVSGEAVYSYEYPHRDLPKKETEETEEVKE